MKAQTQRERVLAKAKSFDGVSQSDFLLPDVCDGGPPITRVAARLYDLDLAGHVFEAIGWRNKTKVFRWVEGPEVEDGSGGNPPPVSAVRPVLDSGVGGGDRPGSTSPVSSGVPTSLSVIAPSTGKLFDLEPVRSHYEDAA